MSKSKILLAVLAGATAAAALAYLFATDSGAEVRKKIADAAEDLSNKIMRKASSLADDSMEQLGDSRSRAKTNA